jgi:uncharacterized membrane protein
MSQPDQPRRRDRTDLFAALTFLAGLAAAAYMWRFGPAGLIPMHLGFRGQANWWGDRTADAVLIAGVTLGLGLAYAFIGAFTHGAGTRAAAPQSLRTARQLIVFIGAMVIALQVVMAYGGTTSPKLGGGRLMPAMLALIFLVIGALLGKAGPNPFVGVRTYWTYRSRLAWDKSNRLIGRLFFWIGLAGLVASPFADPAFTTSTLIVAILAAAAASVFESWRVWRTDQERLQP